MSLLRLHLALALVAIGGVSVTSRADAPAVPVRASIVCEAPPAPGRFRCDVELRAPEGRLSWAEVEVTFADDFVLPLRGRLGPRDAATHDPDIFRWSLGFVAKSRGAGKVTVRVHAVLCRGPSCDPVTAEVSGRVVVAGASPP
jgi:hypothetical protein